MSIPEIGLVVARADNGVLRLLVNIDGKTEEFVMARHVAASTIEALAKALAKTT